MDKYELFLSKYMYNMPFKVMSIFTKIPRPAKMMLDKASSEFCIQASKQC